MPVKPALDSSLPAAGPVTLRRVALRCSLAPRQVLGRLRDEPLPFLLTGAWAGGGAVLGSDPMSVAAADEDPFAVLDRRPVVAGGEHLRGPAVGGGWFGWLGYRLAALVERVPDSPPRPVVMPSFHLAYYDHVLRQDPAGRWWFEMLWSAGRGPALARRLRRIRGLLAAGEPGSAVPEAPGPLRLSAPGAAAHLEAVRQARRRIHAGEVFQANICLRLDASWPGRATDLFAQALSRTSPAYGAVFDTPHGAIASLSPELFLRRRGRHVVTAPIKGTSPRDPDPARAAAALAQLRGSVKDAAEHVMIVDLMRNDLGRVCSYGSIQAEREPTAEPHPGLWHLVSRVHGLLRCDVGDAELLRATFPPGSVTGAPKVRSLQVIAELERTGREVYTGAIGFASPVAGLELSVAIRTLELSGGRLWLGVGGGIVADSDPQRELEEALLKAAPIAAAIGSSVLVGRGDRGARAA